MDNFVNGFNNFFGGSPRGGNNANRQMRGNQAQYSDPQMEAFRRQFEQQLVQFQNQIKSMGMQHSDRQIRDALRAANGDAEKGLDILLVQEPKPESAPGPQAAALNGISSYGQQFFQPTVQNTYGVTQSQMIAQAQVQEHIEKEQIQQALIQDQITQARGARKGNDYEPLPIGLRQREQDVPSGLKNIGNTCYFASLIQALFFLPNFQEKILSLDESLLSRLQQTIDENRLSQVEKTKLQSSRDIVMHLQRLFAEMLCSNEKYRDPTKVLESIVDDNGQKIPIYEQKDIGEFFLNFLERLQDGLGENKQMIRKMLGDELIKELQAGKQQNLIDLAPGRQLSGGSKPQIQRQHQNGGDLHDIEPEGNGEKTAFDLIEQNGNKLLEYDYVATSESASNSQNPQMNDKSDYETAGDQDISIGQSMDLLKMQSMIDPSKQSMLMNYGLDAYKNSIWENFLGSQVQVSSVVDPDGTSKVHNQNIDKMGPIQLRVDEGKLYQAWEQFRKSEIEGYRGEKEGQKKVLETWICRPPNILMFQLNRVNYDIKNQKLVKDHSKFEFDKTIYLDLFLNQNREKAQKLQLELEQMRIDLKLLQETYQQYQEAQGPGKKLGQLVEVFQTCEDYLSASPSLVDGQDMTRSIQIQNKSFEFCDPQQLTRSQFGVSHQEIEIAKHVLRRFKSTAQNQVDVLEHKIKQIEQILEKPYIKERQRPYYLHAVMIHDGVAESGHYYTYIFDRRQNTWWKLDDHRVSKATEEDVMKEAQGGDGYKSACNLFYISQHIADLMDNERTSVYDSQRADKMQIPAGVRKEIMQKNAEFSMKNFQYRQAEQSEKAVKQINQCFKERLQKQDSQRGQLQQIVETKLFSFYYYLVSISHKGYGRWTLLSQTVKEYHPQEQSLSDILKSNGTAGAPTIEDEVFNKLKAHFSEKFLMLSPTEEVQLQQRESEYKDLMKKALMLQYMMININPQNIKQTLNVYFWLQKFTQGLKQKHGNNYQKIADWDRIGNEIVQIFMIKLIINMTQKYASSDQGQQDDAFRSAKLLAVMANQFLSKDKAIYKQFDSALATMTFFYKKNEGRLPAPSVQRLQDLFKQFREGSFSLEDKFALGADEANMPVDVMQEVKKIDGLNVYEYQDGIETESLSYKFNNILQMFRVDFAVEIKVQTEIVRSTGQALSESDFGNLLKNSGYHAAKYMNSDLFPPAFDFRSILGEPDLLSLN